MIKYAKVIIGVRVYTFNFREVHMLNIQNYVKVSSLSEAWELNQKKANRIVGGMMWMRMGDSRINTAIDLSGLGLDNIEETEEEFRIGCMTTLRQLETNEAFNHYTNGTVKEALRHIVGVQFRNLATVGGSIYGRYGFSDVLTLLIGLDSYVETFKGGLIPLKEYSKMKYDNDILVNIIIKKRPVNMFYEAVRITETDLPVLTCCAVHFKDDNTFNVAIGARPGRAILVDEANSFSDKDFTKFISDKALIEAFAQNAKASVPTESNMRGSSEYRSHLVYVLTQRAIDALTKY